MLSPLPNLQRLQLQAGDLCLNNSSYLDCSRSRNIIISCTKADISRAELQEILAENFLDPFERIYFGLDDLPAPLLEEISLAGISEENGLESRKPKVLKS
jgi:hypothetical protein